MVPKTLGTGSDRDRFGNGNLSRSRTGTNKFASIFSSAFLLALSYPKFNLSGTAWFALVPALIVARKSGSYAKSFLIFLSIGFLFYLISVEWLRHVTYFGWLFVAALFAVYFGIFGAACKFFLKEGRENSALWGLPAIWALIEFIRTEIPVWGFGWNLLGYSQSGVLPIARLASWLGVYGVSFLIVFINMILWYSWTFGRQKSNRWKVFRKLTYAVLILLIVVFHFGRVQPKPNPENQFQISVSVIQGNIPQSQKWNPEVKSSIIEQYEKLSEFAASARPDLIVWPEAAWPGVLNLDPEREKILNFIAGVKIPLLIGSPYEGSSLTPTLSPGGRGEGEGLTKIYNSAHWIDREGRVTSRYDKIRLVPFGEFVPLAHVFSLFGLEKYAYSLGVGDFSAGSDYTVFEMSKDSKPVRFSSLICFEDTFPELARQFVKRGARFLAVITNDAWFGKSAAPYQHLQASIFRAIEEGIPVIRAANTGVSAFILSSGEVIGRVKDQRGHDTWIAGGLTMPVSIETGTTFYCQAGFLFPLACLLIAIFSFAIAKI